MQRRLQMMRRMASDMQDTLHAATEAAGGHSGDSDQASSDVAPAAAVRTLSGMSVATLEDEDFNMPTPPVASVRTTAEVCCAVLRTRCKQFIHQYIPKLDDEHYKHRYTSPEPCTM